MRIKSKISETPIPRTAKAAVKNTDINKEKRKVQTNKRTVFPFQYETDGLLRRNLQARLIDTTLYSSRRHDFIASECKRSIEEIIRELNYRLEYKDSYEDNLIELTTKLFNDYFESSIYLDGLLEKRFDKASTDREKKIILDILFLAGDGYSNLLDRVLKNGEEDQRYTFCFNYLKELNPELKKEVVLSAWCEERNAKKTRNLVKTLVTVFGEDYIIATVNEFVESCFKNREAGNNGVDWSNDESDSNISLIRTPYEEDDDDENTQITEEELEITLNEELEGITERQKLLLAVLQNSEQGRVKELISLFNAAVSWEVSNKALLSAVKTLNGDETKLAKLFYEIAKNTEKNLTPISVGFAINSYAILLKERAPESLKKIISGSDDPAIAHNFVYSMITLCGKEGEKAVTDIITKDLKLKRKSPILLFLFHMAKISDNKEDTTYKKALAILHKVFLMNEDIASFVEMNVNSDTGLAQEFDQTWTWYRRISPKITDLISYIDFERYASWMMYDKNFNVRNNTRSLLAKALSEERSKDKSYSDKTDFDKILDDFIRKGIQEKSKIAKDFVNWMDSI